MKSIALVLVTSMLVACGSSDEDPTPAPKTDTNATVPAGDAPSDPGVAPAAPADDAPPALPPSADPTTTPETPSDPGTDPSSTPPSGDPYSPPTSPVNPADPWAAVDPSTSGSGGFTPGWRLLGSYTFGGFSTSFSVPTGLGTIGHIVLEAPASCAPQLTQAYVATTVGYVPVWFQAQRTVYPDLQALLVVGNGTPTFATSLTLGFASTLGTMCPISVYAVGN